MFETEYQIQCRDRVNILRQLKAGNAQELAATLEQRLPQWAAGVPTVVRNKQRVQMILWDVQRYYEENGVTIPANLRPVLDSQPPRPLTSGELKKKNGE
jgi:hypothetical protein